MIDRKICCYCPFRIVADACCNIVYRYTKDALYNKYKQVYRRRYESRRSSKPKLHLKKKIIKYGEKRFSIWRMELLHHAMWHVALKSWQWIHQVASPCNVIRWSGMTCHGIRPNVRRVGILHLVSILTISRQSTCHSAPACKILSKSDHPRQTKNDVMSIFKIVDLSHLGFQGPIMGSLKSPCTTFYRSSVDTIAVNCLVFWENRVFAIWRQTGRQTDRQTDEQIDTPVAWSRSRCRERRL